MYKLSYSETFDDDIEATRDYIIDELDEPSIAENLFTKLIEKIEHIEVSPYTWALLQDNDLALLGFRSLQVKKYRLIYVVNEENKIVRLVRFLHSRTDWMNITKESIDQNQD